MFTKKFWKSASERAIKSGAQFGLLTGGAEWAFDVLTVNSWVALVAAFGSGAVFSVLTSLASAKISGDPESPSLVAEGPAGPGEVAGH